MVDLETPWWAGFNTVGNNRLSRKRLTEDDLNVTDVIAERLARRGTYAEQITLKDLNPQFTIRRRYRNEMLEDARKSGATGDPVEGTEFGNELVAIVGELADLDALGKTGWTMAKTAAANKKSVSKFKAIWAGTTGRERLKAASTLKSNAANARAAAAAPKLDAEESRVAKAAAKSARRKARRALKAAAEAAEEAVAGGSPAHPTSDGHSVRALAAAFDAVAGDVAAVSGAAGAAADDNDSDSENAIPPEPQQGGIDAQALLVNRTIKSSTIKVFNYRNKGIGLRWYNGVHIHGVHITPQTPASTLQEVAGAIKAILAEPAAAHFGEQVTGKLRALSRKVDGWERKASRA